MVFELKTVEWRKKNAHIVFIKIWFKVFLLGSGIFLVEAIYNKLLRSMESNGNMAGLCFKDGCFITVRIQTLFPRSVFVGRLLDQWEESLVPLWLYIIVQSQQGSLWEQSNWDLLTWRWQRGESRCAGSWAINRCGYGWTGETWGTCWPSSDGRRARHTAELLTGRLTELLSCQGSSVLEMTADATRVCWWERQELC